MRSHSFIVSLLLYIRISGAFLLRATANLRAHHHSWNKNEQWRRYTNTAGISTEDTKNESCVDNDVLQPTDSNKYPSTPTFRECLNFALPAFGIYVCPPLMSLIDAAFVGRVSSLELAALGPASSISDSAANPLLFLSIASTNLIAKSFAQNDQPASARVSRTAIGMGTISGFIIAALLFVKANTISTLYCGGSTASLAMIQACTKYVTIRALALPFVVITTIAQAICIGTKDTKTPMISVLLAGACNLFGDMVLVKWLGRGIAGAAWATSASQIVAAGLLMSVLRKRGFLRKEITNNKETKDANEHISTISTIKQLLAFIPFLYVMMVKIGWHNSCAAAGASLGGVSAAAYTALFSVTMLCMVFGDVGSSLSQAFLPAFERPATSKSAKPTFDMEAAMPTIKQLLKCTLSISTFVTALASIIIGVLGGRITNNPAVLSEMRRNLPLIIATLSFHGTAVTLEGLMLAQKKFRSLSACYTVLAVAVAAYQVAIRKFGLGLTGVCGTYVWFCAARVISFSALGGLLRPRLWLQRMRKEIKLR